MRFKCESVKVNVCARKSSSFEPGFFPRFLMQNQWELFSSEVNNKVCSKTWNLPEYREIKKKRRRINIKLD